MCDTSSEVTFILIVIKIEISCDQADLNCDFKISKTAGLMPDPSFPEISKVCQQMRGK